MFQSKPSNYSIPKERQVCFCVIMFYACQSTREGTVSHLQFTCLQNFVYLNNIFFHFLLQSRVFSEVVCEILDLHLALFTIAFSFLEFISFRLSMGIRTPLKSSYACSQIGTKRGLQIQQFLFFEDVQILMTKSLAVQIINPLSLYHISKLMQ